MKKILREKSLLFLFFAAVVAMTVTACSGSKDSGTSSKKTENEYVYQASFQKLDLDVDSINNVCIEDGTIYMYGEKWVENKKKGTSTTYRYLVSCDLDGSNMVSTELKGFKTSEYPTSMTSDEGKIRFLTQQYKYNKKTGDSKQAYFVRTLNKKGNFDTVELKLKSEQSNLDDEEGFYIEGNHAAIVQDVLYVAMDGKIYNFDLKNGKQGKTYQNKDMNYIDALFRANDGTIYVYGYNNDKTVIQKYDPETGTFGDTLDFGDYTIYNLNIQRGEGSVIYINDTNNMYSFDLSTGKIQEEFSWINSDIDGSSVSGFCPLEDGKMIAITSNYEESTSKTTMELVTLNKKKASEVQEKKKLRLYCSYLDYNLKSKILAFNKKNEDYRIEVKDYSAYDDAAKQLNLDLTSGDIPDILELSYGVSREKLAKKGVLTDLYPFMEKDEEVKKEDFIPSVLSSLEIDGKLYAMGSGFSVQGLLGGKKMIGDREGWTVDEMIEAYEAAPEGTEFMQYESRQSFLSDILYYCMNDYVDWTNGTVSFDSDDFVKLMEFSMKFPDSDDVDYNNYESMPTLVKKGKLFLDSFYLWGVDNIQLYTKLYKKQGGYSVVGYPSKDRSNKLSMSMDGTSLAITQQCDDKDAAWNFIREFYTYEYQKENDSGSFPTRQDVFDKMMEYAMATEAYTDDDGTEVEPIDSSYGYDDYEVKLGPVSEEEVEMMRSMIDRIGYCTTYDSNSSDIRDIVTEESEAFFKGDKTAKETADVIQSRVKIYVSENS